MNENVNHRTSGVTEIEAIKPNFLQWPFFDTFRMFQSVGLILLAFSVSVISFDNNCLLNDANLTPPTKNAPQTFLKDCPGWIIESTDAAWNNRQGNVLN